MLFSKHEDEGQAKTVVSRNMESIPIGNIAEPNEVARAIRGLGMFFCKSFSLYIV